MNKRMQVHCGIGRNVQSGCKVVAVPEASFGYTVYKKGKRMLNKE